MYEFLIIVFLIIAIAIIGLVLIQKGKGADMGASFGAGASGTLFGSAGTGNFLTRATTILGILFFIISIILANIGSKKQANSTFWNLPDGTPATAVSTPASATDVEGQNSVAPASEVASPESTSPTSEIPE